MPLVAPKSLRTKPASALQSSRPGANSRPLLKNDWVMTVSRPSWSRTTMRASPLPLKAGRLSIANGPVGTLEVCRNTSLMYSSTVDGAPEMPFSTGIGWLTNPGVSAKLLPNWMPPKYTLRPSRPARVALSPKRKVLFCSGKLRVNVVSRRVKRLGVPKVLLRARLRAEKLLVTTPQLLEKPSSPSKPKSSMVGAARSAERA